MAMEALLLYYMLRINRCPKRKTDSELSEVKCILFHRGKKRGRELLYPASIYYMLT